MKGTVRLLTPHEATELFAGAAGESPWYRLEGAKLAVPVLLRLSRTPEGEIACTAIALGLEAHPPERVTASALRIPLQELVADLVRGMRWDHIKTKSGGIGFWGRLEEMGVLVDQGARVGEPRARPGARGYTDEDLRIFASDYRLAIKTNPRAPTKLLARFRRLSDQAIRYQRRLAEERGFLRPRAQRRARKTRKGGQRR